MDTGNVMTWFDLSASRLEKAKHAAANAGVEVRWVRSGVAVFGPILTAAIVLLTGCHAAENLNERGKPDVLIHYQEIVCRNVPEQCAALEQLHGLSFGEAVPDLGGARVAEAPDGSLIGVRAPLAEHEQPIIRTYLQVSDIAKAVEEAEAAGAVIAYPPTRQGNTGTWAIYILGDIQFGLWQRLE